MADIWDALIRWGLKKAVGKPPGRRRRSAPHATGPALRQSTAKLRVTLLTGCVEDPARHLELLEIGWAHMMEEMEPLLLDALSEAGGAVSLSIFKATEPKIIDTNFPNQGAEFLARSETTLTIGVQSATSMLGKLQRALVDTGEALLRGSLPTLQVTDDDQIVLRVLQVHVNPL